MARRLLPALLLLPLAIGWLRLQGERSGLFESDLGVALVAVTYAVCLLAITWLSASSVNRTDLQKREAEEALRSSREFISSILDTVDEGFIVIDRDYRIISANKAYCRQVNMPIGDIAGKHCHEISHQSIRPCYEIGEECAVRHSFEKGEPMYVFRTMKRFGNIYVETKSYPSGTPGNVTSVQRQSIT
jgi:PAS domain-containing protein